MQITETARVLAELGIGRAFIGYHAHIRRDPLAQLFTRRGRQNPYPIYERVRALGPFPRSSFNSLLLVDHAHCHQVLRSRDFGVSQIQSPSRAVDLSLLILDPPDHTRLRRLISSAFAPARIREQEERIQNAANRLVDEFAARLADGPVDLMGAYAKPLPIVMIAALMGVPDHEVPALGRHGDAIGGVLDGLQSLRHYRELSVAQRELHALFHRLVEQRRAAPGSDVISDLVTALDHQELTAEEFESLCTLLLVAGFETTVNLIGNAMSALLVRPHLWRRLVEKPGLVDRVVEETLRWDSPVQATVRAAMTDVELGGRILRPGQLVSVLIAGANRDPKVFDRPDVFDIDRPNAAEHLSFGHGIHHCIGRPLAMLEARIALRTLVTRLPDLKPAGPPTEGSGYILRGRATLPVRL
ncbi:cytochrome P450 [Granulicoccus sp. GXG6511]|uniref:cytochrome P450 n=1 Tax=Granulicoccus sp. GXG6511 TaxID=3381351 RepID=UPI003D7E3401